MVASCFSKATSRLQTDKNGLAIVCKATLPLDVDFPVPNIEDLRASCFVLVYKDYECFVSQGFALF